jgi:hypothetical protein
MGLGFYDYVILVGLLSACGFFSYLVKEIGNAIQSILHDND